MAESLTDDDRPPRLKGTQDRGGLAPEANPARSHYIESDFQVEAPVLTGLPGSLQPLAAENSDRFDNCAIDSAKGHQVMSRAVIRNEPEALADLPTSRTKPPWLEGSTILPFSSLTSDEFEVLCFLLLRRENPNAEVLYYGKTGDRGRDIVINRENGDTHYFQCKHYSANIGVGEIRSELAKLFVNVQMELVPGRPDHLTFLVTTKLTAQALDLLRSQRAWKAVANDALTNHLGHEPVQGLLDLANHWWPQLAQTNGVDLSDRLRGYPELINQFFSYKKVLDGSLDDVESVLLSDKKELKKERRLASESMRRGRRHEAQEHMLEALSIARANGRESDEAEILAGLALMASRDPRNKSETSFYFQEAERKFQSVESGAAKAIYLRARAAALTHEGNHAQAESVLKEALALCTNEPEDDKGNLAIQACIIRSSLVHLLCNEGRHEDAAPFLEECENYARSHSDHQEGELLQAALEAGIHYSLDVSDEDGAIARIDELEEAAISKALAYRIGGDLVNVANRAAQRDAFRSALSAARAAIRLGQRCHEPKESGNLLAALYTEAMVLFRSDRIQEASVKADAILKLCGHPNDLPVKQATQQLVGEIRRISGDSHAAILMAQQALDAASGDPENAVFSMAALARALDDNGRTEEALEQVQQARLLAKNLSIPVEGMVDLLAQVSNYASQLGSTEVLGSVLKELEDLGEENTDLADRKQRTRVRAFANLMLREKLAEFSQESAGVEDDEVEQCQSLQEANARVIEPLLDLWREYPSALAGAYDFWGRGNFGRLLRNSRRFPNTFNITVEVRSFSEIKRALRLWGLYADLIILLWKGKCENGLAMVPIPEDYRNPGGWGYKICDGDVLEKEGSDRRWHPALGFISIFPEEIARFLATEALPFVKSGRLVVVPAVGAGCVNPGHGPFEQLLAEAANAVPNVCCRGARGTPIGLLPHSPDVPFDLLADIVESEARRLRQLRLLLMKRSRALRPDRELTEEARLLTMEIDDSLRDLADANKRIARRNGLATAEEPILGATAPFRSSGRELSDRSDSSPFAPLLMLQHFGYGWRVDSSEVLNLPSRFEPEEGDIIGTWLAPPSPGWEEPTAVQDSSR